LTIAGNGNHASHIVSIVKHYMPDIKVYRSSIEKISYVETSNLIIAVGNNNLRYNFSKQARELGYKQPSLHILADSIFLDEDDKGNQYMKGSVIYPTAHIGASCIINSGAVVEHHSKIDNGSHIAPSAVVLGNVYIGKLCDIGANSTILQNVKISDNITVGANSLVLDDLDVIKGTYFGVPAKLKLEKFKS
jgi:sugar O-acyltransferase (sialic acid O-acetyltransferase NeuD family)